MIKIEKMHFLVFFYFFEIYSKQRSKLGFDNTDRGIRVDFYHGMVKNNKKGRLCINDDIFIFANNANKCTIHTLFH